jgi:hypothetical protein
MRSVRIALVAALVVLAVAIGLTLSVSPVAVIATNGIPDAVNFAGTRSRASACQPNETVPAGTSGIRIALGAEIGPAVALVVKSAGRVVTRGAVDSGWTGASVTIPMRRVSRTVADAEICFALGSNIEDLEIFGEEVARPERLVASTGERLPGRMGVEYLRPAHSTWLSLAPGIAERMGFGHAWPGTWVVFALLAAMACGAGAATWMVFRELR